MILKLDVKLRTPTPPAPEATLWESKTLSNARELESQSTLIRNRMQRHQDSSPTSIIAAIDQLKKGAEVIMHSAVLMRDRIISLERANDAAVKRKQRKKKRIQKRGTLTKAEGEEIIAQKNVNDQLEGEKRQSKAQSGASRQAIARCGRCREPGHNSRTCQKDTVDTIQ